MELQERNQMDPQYQWDLSSLYENDAAWEADFASAPTLIEKTAAFQGKLTGAAKVRACLDASTELTRRLDNLLTYAQLRQSEDTRSTKAQELWALRHRRNALRIVSFCSSSSTRSRTFCPPNVNSS